MIPLPLKLSDDNNVIYHEEEMVASDGVSRGFKTYIAAGVDSSPQTREWLMEIVRRVNAHA